MSTKRTDVPELKKYLDKKLLGEVSLFINLLKLKLMQIVRFQDILEAMTNL
jgi:hypothetical protein